MSTRRPRRFAVKIVNGKPLDETSSLNDYYMCICGRKYHVKLSLSRHAQDCNGQITRHWCSWCNLVFSNRGNLATHAKHMHGVKFVNTNPAKSNTEYKCDGCDVIYKERWRLKFHIRRHHFNLWAKIPHAEVKQINQVWFENVQNTNLVVQIQKTGQNKLVLKPSTPDASIEIHNSDKVIDLHKLYPTTNRSLAEATCKICQKVYRKIDLQKHINETHYNIAKHKCNNCNMTFKRSYIYLQHICNKGNKRKHKVNGVQHDKHSTIRISSVESLNAFTVD